MNPDLARVAKAFGDVPLVDEGLLKPGGRREVIAAIREWDKRGLHARMMLVPRGSALEPWRGLWHQLGLDPKRDLLLLFNGQRWEARGWGLSPNEIERALAAAKDGLSVYWGRGLVQAIDQLGAANREHHVAATTDPKRGPTAKPPLLPPAESTAFGPEFAWVGWGLGGVAIGAITWILTRRQKRATEAGTAFEQARTAAESAYADLMIAADELATHGLDAETSAALQTKAARLADQLDTIVRTAGRDTHARQNPVTIGKLQQLESEIAALRSTLLQHTRRT